MKNSDTLFKLTDRGLQTTRSFRLLFLISCVTMTHLFVSNDIASPTLFSSLGLIIAAVIWAYLIFKKDLAENLFSGLTKKKLIVFGALSLYLFLEYFYKTPGSIVSHKNDYIDLVGNIDPSLSDMIINIYIVLICVFMLLSTFAICGFLYAFQRKLSEIAAFFYSKSDKTEIYFVAVAWVIFSVLILIIFSKTAVFYLQYNDLNGEPAKYDFIYTTDSPMEMTENIFFKVNASHTASNYLRHPFFGLFSMPFALPCMLLSRILFFVPNVYALLIALMQAFIILISDVLIIRMLKLRGAAKLTALIAYTATYSALLHYVALGRFVFSTFWILLIAYLFTEKRIEREECFYPASGATITSLALFPFTKEFKGFKEFFIEGAKFVRNFFMIYFLFISLENSRDLGMNISLIFLFSGAKIPFEQHIYQFFNFVKSIFIWPVSERTERIIFQSEILSYQLAEVTSPDVIGVILFCLAVAGFIVNRKDKFAQICIYWAAFSVFVLMIFGWGTSENGLIIYALYFGWPYFGLIAMLAEKLLSKLKNASAAFYAVLAVIMVVFNAYHLYDMFQFCFECYPIENALR